MAFYNRQVTIRDLTDGTRYMVTAENKDTFDEMEAHARKFYRIPADHELNIEEIEQIR